MKHNSPYRARILDVQGAQESIPPAYVAWQAGTTTLQYLLYTSPPCYIGWRNRFLGSWNVYKFGLWVKKVHVACQICKFDTKLCMLVWRIIIDSHVSWARAYLLLEM